MGMLAVGAGAADGLKEFLIQELRKQQVDQDEQRIVESTRHNQASEVLQNRQIDENSKLRQATQAATESERLRLKDNRDRDDARASLDDVMGGSPISIATRDNAVKLGAAVPERFKEVIPFDRDFMGPVNETGPQRGEVGSYTLADTPKKVGSEGTLQQKTYTWKGKPIDADFNSKTGAVTYRGQDITNEVEHRDAPGQPSFSPVQSGDGYITFNRKSGKFEDSSGKEVPNPALATTSSTRTMEEGAKMLRPHIPKLSATAEELEKIGQFGPVMSRIRHAAEKLGTTGTPEEVQASFDAVGREIANDPELNKNRLVGKFATSLGLMTSGAGRVHGGARGGGSIQMINYMKSLLSDSSDINMFLGRLDSLDEYIVGYAEGPNKDGAAAPPDDLYQQYLNRKP